MGIPRPASAACLVAANKFYIAEAHRQTGNLAAAIPAFHEALPALKAIGNAQGVAGVYTLLSVMLLDQGRTREAIAHATVALAAEPNPAPGNSVIVFLTIARSHGLSGDGDSAARAIALLRDFEPWGGFSPYDEGRILTARASLAALRGSNTEAHALLHAARVLARRHEAVMARKDVMVLEYWALECLSSLKCAEGKPSQAAELAITAAAVLHAADCDPAIPEILVLLAEALDDDDAADRLLLAVAPHLYRNGLAQHLAIALLRYAAITQRRGDWELAAQRARRAVEYLDEIDIKDERRRAIAQEIIDYRP